MSSKKPPATNKPSSKKRPATVTDEVDSINNTATDETSPKKRQEMRSKKTRDAKGASSTASLKGASRSKQATPEVAKASGQGKAPAPQQRSPQKENAERAALTLCKKCNSRPLGILFLPCTHVVCCEECGQNMTECNVCRKEIAVHPIVRLNTEELEWRQD